MSCRVYVCHHNTIIIRRCSATTSAKLMARATHSHTPMLVATAGHFVWHPHTNPARMRNIVPHLPECVRKSPRSSTFLTLGEIISSTLSSRCLLFRCHGPLSMRSNMHRGRNFPLIMHSCSCGGCNASLPPRMNLCWGVAGAETRVVSSPSCPSMCHGEAIGAVGTQSSVHVLSTNACARLQGWCWGASAFCVCVCVYVWVGGWGGCLCRCTHQEPNTYP